MAIGFEDFVRIIDNCQNGVLVCITSCLAVQKFIQFNSVIVVQKCSWPYFNASRCLQRKINLVWCNEWMQLGSISDKKSIGIQRSACNERNEQKANKYVVTNLCEKWLITLDNLIHPFYINTTWTGVVTGTLVQLLLIWHCLNILEPKWFSGEQQSQYCSRGATSIKRLNTFCVLTSQIIKLPK